MKLLKRPIKPSNSPAMVLPLQDPRYQSWRGFVSQSLPQGK
jgi:hypothetical protein